MHADQIPRKSNVDAKIVLTKSSVLLKSYTKLRNFFSFRPKARENPTPTQNEFWQKRSCNSSEFPPSCCLRKIIFIDHNYNIFLFQSRFSFHIFSTDKADAMSNDGTSNHWFEPLLTAILAKVTRPGALRRFARNHNNYRNRQDKEFRLVSWTTLTASARNARQSLSKKYMLATIIHVSNIRRFTHEIQKNTGRF